MKEHKTDLHLRINSSFKDILNAKYPNRIGYIFEKVMRSILKVDELVENQETEELDTIENQIHVLKVKAELIRQEKEKEGQRELKEYIDYEKKNWQVIINDFKEIFWNLPDNEQKQIKQEYIDYIQKNEISDNELTLVHYWSRNYRKQMLKEKIKNLEIGDTQ